MANRERVLVALAHAELCDDCLSLSSGVRPRQTVFTVCSSLAKEVKIHRHQGRCDHCHKTKNTSRLLETPHLAATSLQDTDAPSDSQHRPWYWEGNVQSAVVNYLVHNNCEIRSVADTASRLPGVDIIAITAEGKELWISVKGYPDKSPNVQARHWFSGAVFDLILYHGENPDVQLGIALPYGFATYKNLLPRIKWLKETLAFHVYWVNENKEVRLE